MLSRMGHTIMVMWKGKVVNQGGTKDVFDNPQQAYMQELLSAAGG